jgi:hypothetical protein
VRPFAPVLHLRERTAHDFTLTWRAPKARDGDGDGTAAAITHYAIDLATTSPAGTYYPWRELWCGAGHARPDLQEAHHEKKPHRKEEKEERKDREDASEEKAEERHEDDATSHEAAVCRRVEARTRDVTCAGGVEA